MRVLVYSKDVSLRFFDREMGSSSADLRAFIATSLKFFACKSCAKPITFMYKWWMKTQKTWWPSPRKTCTTIFHFSMIFRFYWFEKLRLKCQNLCFTRILITVFETLNIIRHNNTIIAFILFSFSWFADVKEVHYSGHGPIFRILSSSLPILVQWFKFRDSNENLTTFFLNIRRHHD